MPRNQLPRRPKVTSKYSPTDPSFDSSAGYAIGHVAHSTTRVNPTTGQLEKVYDPFANTRYRTAAPGQPFSTSDRSTYVGDARGTIRRTDPDHVRYKGMSKKARRAARKAGRNAHT